MAIITDKLRLLNSSNFINDVANGNYYMFVGFPNATSYYPNWDSSRPDPIDNFYYLNSYRDNILGVKKITSTDVVRVIPKIAWTNGKKYEMYRHDYSVYNITPVTGSTRLYDSLFYVMNSEYRVYICINNGSAPSNNNTGVISTQEPLHTDLTPKKESDGYIWKYLYTLFPADVLKFDSTNFIAVPNNWTTTTNQEINRVRTNSVSGKIETILVEYQGQYNYSGTLTNVPIRGDGTGGLASITFDDQSRPVSVQVTNGGSGYTFATLDLDSILAPIGVNKAIFNVIIPPPGGHGANVYTELGSYRVLVYSRIENDSTNPDFIVGNQFSRVGIIKDIRPNGVSDQNSTVFSENSGSGVYALKLTTSTVTEPFDSKITQDNTNAVGNLVSFDTTTKVLKFIQPRTNFVDLYLNGENYNFDYNYANSISGIQTSNTYKLEQFNSTTIKIGSNSYSVDSGFSGNSVDIGAVTYYLGQQFSSGLSLPDINIKSGEIIYVDNRESVTRSSQQREDIKIILEF